MEINEDRQINLKKEKETVFLEEKSNLMQIFQKIGAVRSEVCNPLIEEAAYMKAALFELRNEIDSNGYTEAYQNGEHQKGLKMSASLDAYLKTMKSYRDTIKYLLSLVPASSMTSKKDALQEFLDAINSESEAPNDWNTSFSEWEAQQKELPGNDNQND